MDTDQLIKTLAADNSHRARPVGFVLMLALLAAAPVSLVMFFGELGFRPDIMTAMRNPFFDLKFAVTLALAVSAFTQNKWVVLALLNLLFLLLGMFLHSAAAIILVVPVVMPLVKAVGIDPVHFGLIVTVNLGIGQQTPPVASVLMVASAISKASIWEVTRVNVWFIGVLVAVLLLVTYVPVTGMGLVELFYR